MKLAILSNTKNSFVKPLAEGLARMSQSCGATAVIHDDGLDMLSLPLGVSDVPLKTAVRLALRFGSHRRQFAAFVQRLRGADAIVVVAHVPGSVSRHTLGNLEKLRRLLPECPIVNYDLVYLPTTEKWGATILRGESTGLSPDDLRLLTPPPFGMERYDWYLVVSEMSEVPMPAGRQPYSRIGIDIDDGTLYPHQRGEFKVLVDFKQTRKDYPSYRKVQLEALEKSGVSFQVLEGRLSREDIRAIYRRTSLFMLAHRESFGLPICEVQACGSRIITPRAEWAGAHWIKDPAVGGPGVHSGNFIVYENTVEGLTDCLRAARERADPEAAVRTFREAHPQLFHGDRDALSAFLGMIESGSVHSRLHAEHAGVGR